MDRDRKNWQRLVVDWNVSLNRNLSAGLSARDKERARLTAFKAAVDGKPVPTWAQINNVAWENPDAGEKGKRKEVSGEDIPNFLISPTGLSTLNRGKPGWLSSKLAISLAQLGGELNLAKPTGKRKPKPKRKIKGARKKVGHVAAKGTAKRSVEPQRSHKRTGKKGRVQAVGHHQRAARSRQDNVRLRRRRKA
jgi:hypothetical protein